MHHDSSEKLFLASTPIIESTHPLVRDFAKQYSKGCNTNTERAVKLYTGVRDTIHYDPYTIRLSRDGLKASTTLKTGRGWCVSKAVVLAAVLRAENIPARLGFADVKNHICSPRLKQIMQTDVFYWHGYTEIYLNQRWVKATPAFNSELCEKFNIQPLAFDGTQDSIYQPFDLCGNRHMEYVRLRGAFNDVPIEAIDKTFRERYPFYSLMADREIQVEDKSFS